MNKIKDICLIIGSLACVIIGVWFVRNYNPKTIEPDKKTYCADAEDFGYANGLVMAGRIQAEGNMLKEQGWNKNEPTKTCQQIIDELYEVGHPVASRQYKFNRDYDLKF